MCCDNQQLNKYRFKALRPELDGSLHINNRHIFIKAIDKFGTHVLPKDFITEPLPIERMLEGQDFPSIGMIVNILAHNDMRQGTRYQLNTLLPQAPVTVNTETLAAENEDGVNYDLTTLLKTTLGDAFPYNGEKTLSVERTVKALSGEIEYIADSITPGEFYQVHQGAKTDEWYQRMTWRLTGEWGKGKRVQFGRETTRVTEDIFANTLEAARLEIVEKVNLNPVWQVWCQLGPNADEIYIYSNGGVNVDTEFKVVASPGIPGATNIEVPVSFQNGEALFSLPLVVDGYKVQYVVAPTLSIDQPPISDNNIMYVGVLIHLPMEQDSNLGRNCD